MSQKPVLCVAFRNRLHKADVVLLQRGANKVCLSSFNPDSLVYAICSALQIGERRDVSSGQIEIRCMGSCEADLSATNTH